MDTSATVSQVIKERIVNSSLTCVLPIPVKMEDFVAPKASPNAQIICPTTTLNAIVFKASQVRAAFQFIKLQIKTCILSFCLCTNQNQNEFI